MALTKAAIGRLVRSVEPAEEAAVEELAALGFRVTIREPARWRDAEPLNGVDGGVVPGSCHAIARTATGKVKSVSGSSATECLQHAVSFLDYQQRRLAPDLRFVPALDGVGAVPVRHEQGGDTARTKARRANTERRLLSLDGTPHLVDAQGAPLEPMHGDVTQATPATH